jgi:hypothetical protein
MDVHSPFTATHGIRYCYCCESLQVRLPSITKAAFDQPDAKMIWHLMSRQAIQH